MCHVRSARARGAVYQGSRSGWGTSVIGEIVILLQGEVQIGSQCFNCGTPNNCQAVKIN